TAVDGKRHEGLLTTPDVVSIHRYLAKLRDQGATHVVMEASSIGLDQHRLDAVDIDLGVFTNLTQDHLDYHGDMQAYAQAKALRCKRPELKHAVINLDDRYAEQMIQNSVAPVLTYAVNNASATLLASAVRQGQATQQFTLQHEDQSIEVKTPFVGTHAIANMLAVAGVLRVLGWSLTKVAATLQQLPAVAGRLEPVEPLVSNAYVPAVMVDYAHTPDALRNVLDALAPMAKARGGRLWCVVGCGGDRDRQKRALMAQVAQSCADRAVLTSDNPRSEDPGLILQEMLSGLTDLSDVSVSIDRAQAILSTIWQAKPEDVVLIAGKGHERYQEVDGNKHVFDDRHWGQLALLMAHNPPAVQTDTRQLQSGALFVALRGERFDGHDYLATAQKVGAVAAIVEQPDEAVNLPQIVLGPTLRALQTLAAAWRAYHDIPVIGITGSNGKTTTKEMTAAICRQWVGADQTLSTVGNLNNEIGVPLTLMNLRPHHQVAVIEMGMNHPGEIERLAAMAQPTVALVLNAQREHQEFMKSVEAVAKENGQALCALSAHGVAVYPANDTYSDLWASLSKRAGKR
ncbi:MAG TPA: UDP-N-acetylmuramyl-tripeptide synthetase, partial [Orrella sp.]